MLFDGPHVTKLGGAETAAQRLEAFDWKAVRGNETNVVVLQLGRRPTTPSKSASIEPGTTPRSVIAAQRHSAYHP